MSILLRIIGALWILLTLRKVFGLFSGVAVNGFRFSLDVTDALSLLMFAGGIGLMLLKKWGWWAILLGAIGFVLVLTGPSLLALQLGPYVLKNLVFYGIFIALLLIPQAKSAVRG